MGLAKSANLSEGDMKKLEAAFKNLDAGGDTAKQAMAEIDGVLD
jgi:hypothetical protein